MKIFLYIFLFLLHVNLLTSNENFIQPLDKEEKTYLESFFHRVIFHDHFAYTLDPDCYQNL